MILGLRAAAKELGMTHVALLKAAKAGRVPRGADGKFDVEKCKAALAANSNPLKVRQARSQQHRKAVTKKVVTTKVVTRPELAVVEIEPAPGSYSDLLRQEAVQKVRARKRDNDLQEGRLVELVPINAYVAGMIIRMRDTMLRIGPELRDRLAQETDPIRIEEMLTRYVEPALCEMAEFKGAQGVGQNA